MKNIFIASDHAGFSLKTFLLNRFKNETGKFEFLDLGPTNETSVDYPDYAKKLCKEVLGKSDSIGILICGSGLGMCMQANRFKKIRASNCWDRASAKLSRQHNDSNVLCLGARLIPFELATDIVKTFLATEFDGGVRHENRIKKLDLA